MRLLLFNPDTEYALASGASFYTPPASVAKLAHDLRLLPQVWARPDDIILVDSPEELHSRCQLASWDSLQDLFEECPDLVVEPWGWNHALRRRLLDAGVPEAVLPSISALDRLRTLAHRRTTISLNARWNDLVAESERVDVPVELRTEEECLNFYRSNPGCWLKAPWSSSGRGVVNTGADMTEAHVRPWCHGILRRQGSVMGETPACRVADFATEWRMRGGVASYLGLSSFTTSRRGKYISNNPAPQADLESEFKGVARLPTDRVIELQKCIIESVLTDYEGLLGIDILVERSGAVRPFVEVNLRRTMGMLYLPVVP